jgi:site-specific recombinase XerD
MSPLAPVLQGFFTDKLLRQRQASPHTVAAYRDTCRLLLEFTSGQARKQPCQLDIADLDAAMITAFLQHLESGRANTVTTRNARLAAIRSLFRYAALHAPEHAAQISRVLAIPPKRSDRAIVCFLTAAEIDALLAAPGQAAWLSRRDHALLLIAVQTGLRVSELTGLTVSDVHLGPGAHVRCHGKGRKDRATPLTRQTVAVLRAWLAERGGGPGDPLFPARAGRRLSRDAVERLVAKHATAAAATCPSLTSIPGERSEVALVPQTPPTAGCFCWSEERGLGCGAWLQLITRNVAGRLARLVFRDPAGFRRPGWTKAPASADIYSVSPCGMLRRVGL